MCGSNHEAFAIQRERNKERATVCSSDTATPFLKIEVLTKAG